jgi:hypothetical protein
VPLIPKYIWKKLNPKINITKGESFCHECGKQLKYVCKLEGSNKTYCRKHAKEEQKSRDKKLTVSSKHKSEKVGKLPSDDELNKLHNEEIARQEQVKKYDAPIFSGYCDFCDKKIGGLDVFKCQYCKQHYCSSHRIPEEHNCTSKKRAILEKKGYVSYK